MLTKSIILSALGLSLVNSFEVEPKGEPSEEFCIMHAPSGLYLNTAKNEDGKNVLKLQKKEDSKD